MIIFHEGLPRSGKSYECLVKQIIPALKKGRKVFAYVEGLNHQKIAELCDITLEQCQRLLTQITTDQVPEIYKYIENDSLIVIDELQDFFPSGRQKLSDGITKFVTQHGHDGQDIVGMGQNLLDCHNLWKRRVQRKIIFTKLDMLGADNCYSWEMYSGKATNKDIKFVKISTGTEKYDPQYFGSYKSHTDETMNVDNLRDDRANIFKTKMFRYGLPAVFLVGFFAVSHLISFFQTPLNAAEKEKNVISSTSSGAPSTRAHSNRDNTQVQSNDARMAIKEAKQEIIGHDQTTDYIETLAKNYRLRLGGYIESNTKKMGFVQFFDNSLRQKELFTFIEMESLGWTIENTIAGVVATKKETKLLIRAWPLESFGKVSNFVSAQL
ncbi:MAG: hypothetical protein KBT51_08880 [Cycloclasticus sp.]|nr:hypothetical protein [Cycloclasticus sp.]